MRKSALWFCVLGFVGVLIDSSIIMAVDTNRPCVDDARKEYESCKAACQEQFLVDKDLCRNVNHECADTCRAEHSLCVEPFLQTLEACKDDCDETLKAQKQACRSQFGEGTTERDHCIDVAQVAGFICRDTCREGVSSQLKQCTKALHACINKCPPAK